MSRWIDIADAIKIMACEMYAEAQSQGFDVDSVEDFIPEAKAWMNDAPSIDIVKCKDCKYDHKCNHSVQRITSKPDYMSIVYVPIGWCERGEREGE